MSNMSLKLIMFILKKHLWLVNVEAIELNGVTIIIPNSFSLTISAKGSGINWYRPHKRLNKRPEKSCALNEQKLEMGSGINAVTN